MPVLTEVLRDDGYEFKAGYVGFCLVSLFFRFILTFGLMLYYYVLYHEVFYVFLALVFKSWFVRQMFQFSMPITKHFDIRAPRKNRLKYQHSG